VNPLKSGLWVNPYPPEATSAGFSQSPERLPKAFRGFFCCSKQNLPFAKWFSQIAAHQKLTELQFFQKRYLCGNIPKISKTLKLSEPSPYPGISAEYLQKH
jgi:hypothetical protein